jgi:hypothetical protein
MEITYQGGASFLITADPVVAINPETAPRDSVVLRTERRKAAKHIVAGPGEYEIKNALIVTVPVGEPATGRLAHAVDLGGSNVLFLEGPAGVLETSARTAIGAVDVLIVDTVDLRAAHELVRDLNPRVVLPFGKAAAELAAALGLKDPQPVSEFSWNGTGATPKAVILKQVRAKRQAA